MSAAQPTVFKLVRPLIRCVVRVPYNGYVSHGAVVVHNTVFGQTITIFGQTFTLFGA